MGVCVSGLTATNCGANGVACQNCASSGQICSNSVCTSGTGGGGGSAAGGGSATGGGSGTCVTYSTFPYQTAAGLSDSSQSTVNVALEGATVADTAFELQLYKIDGGSSAYTANGGLSYYTCRYCAYVLNGCNALPVPGSPDDIFGAATCTGPNYLAQQGTFLISNTTTSSTATGSLSASMAGLHFIEWDFANDVEVDGGGCIDIQSQTINTSW